MKARLASMTLLGGLFVALTSVAPAFAATTTVYPGDMKGWVFLQETSTATTPGTGEMVDGPATPPLGSGSANLKIEQGATYGQVLAKNAYSGLAFKDINALKYSTYRTTGEPALAIALQFDFDNDVTDTDNAFKGRVVYEPYHTQTIKTGEWQSWDAKSDTAGTGTGNWWLSRGALADQFGCTQANPCTFSELISKIPNVGVRTTTNPNVWLKAGSGGGWVNGFDGNVDALTVNSDVYNFDLQAPKPVKATNKDDCKNGGWQEFQTQYKNQGDCVSSVASNGKSGGNSNTSNNPVDQVVNFFRSLTN